MNTKHMITALSLLCFTQMPAALAENAITAGARYHATHSHYLELPFEKGDISYTLGYEYHEASAFWQLLLGYTPDVDKGNDGRGIGVDYVLTPQINLLFVDKNCMLGIGVLSSYMERLDNAKSDWTDIYWQMLFGFQIPLPIFNIDVMAYYPFEEWKTFTDFETKDIEFGVQIKRMF